MHLEERNRARRLAADGLRDALRDIDTVKLPARVTDETDHVYHQFVIRTERRDEVKELLARQGVASAIHYPIPIHRSEAYEALAEGDEDVAPTATRLAGEILSLPIFPSMSWEQIQRVGEALRTFAVGEPGTLMRS
jgi:dTDP-4-amino-4,6-dideoxygalactose transaminase